MKQVVLLLLVLSSSCICSAMIKEPKYSRLTINFISGQTLSGKVKQPFNLSKKIVLILEDNSEKEVPNLDIKSIALEMENGAIANYENVRCYKSIRRKEIEKKPFFMFVVTKGPITLFLQHTEGVTHMTNIGLNGTTSYASFYAIRDGEPAASLLSAVAAGQANPNSVFKNAAPDYFSDYPELAEKIKNKTYTYSDVMSVVSQYNEWKSKK